MTRPRRYFKMTEIALMRRLAEEGKSQAYVSRVLGRVRGVVAGAALRHGIRFHAPKGRPRSVPREAQLARRAEACRRWRARRGAVPRGPRPRMAPVTRFDDPRVMI